MNNSIAVLDSGVSEAPGTRTRSTLEEASADEKNFGEVLDDQLNTGESSEDDATAALGAAAGNRPDAAIETGPPALAAAAATAQEDTLNEAEINTADHPGQGSTPVDPIATVPAPPPVVAAVMLPQGIAETGDEAAGTAQARPARPLAGGSPAPLPPGAAMESAQAAASQSPQAAMAATGVRPAPAMDETVKSDGETGGASRAAAAAVIHAAGSGTGKMILEQNPAAMTIGAQQPAPATQAPAPAHTAATATLPALDHPLGDQRWNTEFGHRIVWALDRGVQAATVALHPRELGPVSIQIAVADDEARLHFNAAHGQTREAIEAALPRLRDMLQSGGITLGQVDISGESQTQAGRGGGAFQQQHGSGSGSGSPPREDQAPQPTVAHYSSRGLVDTFV